MMPQPRFFVHFDYIPGGGRPVEFYTLAGAEQWLANEIKEGRLRQGQASIYDDSGIKL